MTEIIDREKRGYFTYIYQLQSVIEGMQSRNHRGIQLSDLLSKYA